MNTTQAHLTKDQQVRAVNIYKVTPDGWVTHKEVKYGTKQYGEYYRFFLIVTDYTNGRKDYHRLIYYKNIYHSRDEAKHFGFKKMFTYAELMGSSLGYKMTLETGKELVKLILREKIEAKKPEAVWVKCNGEAHGNPWIDNCGVCMPFWGKYPTCPTCGAHPKLTDKGYCSGCHKSYNLSKPVVKTWHKTYTENGVSQPLCFANSTDTTNNAQCVTCEKCKTKMIFIDEWIKHVNTLRSIKHNLTVEQIGRFDKAIEELKGIIAVAGRGIEQIDTLQEKTTGERSQVGQSEPSTPNADTVRTTTT